MPPSGHNVNEKFTFGNTVKCPSAFFYKNIMKYSAMFFFWFIVDILSASVFKNIHNYFPTLIDGDN